MEKNWLIRTRAKQILGPVGKQKILEFVKKGSLSGDDEVSSGNGYWFSIKEKDLLEKYVFGDLPQTFNPITEAPNVLTSNVNIENEVTGSLNPNTMPKKKEEAVKVEEEKVPDNTDLDYPVAEEAAKVPEDDDLAFPDSGDLDYPDMGTESEDITMVGSIPTDLNINKAPEAKPVETPVSPAPTMEAKAPAVGHVPDQVPNTEEEGKLPEGDDLDYPDMGPAATSSPEVTEVDEDVTDPSFEMPSDEVEQAPDLPPIAEEVTEEIQIPVKKKSKKNVKKSKKKKQRNDRYLFYILIILVLSILYGAYFYFTNVISPSVSIRSILIPDVQAQSLLSPMAKKKKSISDLGIIKNELFDIAPIIKGEGLKVAKAVFRQPEDCNYKSEYHLRISLILSKQSNLVKEPFKNFIKKCQKNFEERTLDILHYPYKEGEDLKIIVDYLKSRGFSKEDLKKISNIWKIKNKESKLDSFINLISQIEKTNSDLRKYRIYNQLIDKAKEMDSYFLSSLILSASYGEVGNEGLFNKYFERLLSVNSLIYGMNLDQKYVNKKNIEKYFKVVNFFFSKIQRNISDETILKVFETNFKFLNTEELKIKFKNPDFDWSLSEIRELMNSPRYGLKFPAYWVTQILGRTSSKEVEDYVGQFNNSKYMKKLNPIDFWIFKANIPPSNEAREILYNGLKNNLNSFDSTYLTTLYLLENPSFKMTLGKLNKEFSKPLFTIKRRFYHERLYSGKESTVLVYKLLQMGEEIDEFLWWLML